MNPARRPCTRRIASVAFVSLALAATACGSDSDNAASDNSTSETTNIAFQLDWVKNSEFGGMFVADDAGYYAEEGLDVEFLSGGDVTSTAAVIAGGAAQIGIVSNMARLADAIGTGADLVAVGAVYQVSPAGLMTLPDLSIETAADLNGVRIGTDESGSADIDTLFKVNGLEPDYELVRVGFDAAPLFEDQIDAYYAYVTNQPIPYQLQGIDVNTVTFAELGFASYAGLIVTTREFLEGNRDAVVGFIRATQRGWADTITNTGATSDLTIAKYGADLGLDRETSVASLNAIIELIQSDFTNENGLLAMNPELIAGAMYDALTASGRADLPDPATTFDTSIVADAQQ